MKDIRKLMLSGAVKNLCNEIGCETEYQKLTLKAMIAYVFNTNRGEYGIETDKQLSEVRSAIFGSQMTSLETKVLELACHSYGSDIESYLCESTGYSGGIFEKIFNMINSVE